MAGTSHGGIFLAVGRPQEILLKQTGGHVMKRGGLFAARSLSGTNNRRIRRRAMTPEIWERTSREDAAEQERLYRLALESAIRALDRGIVRGRKALLTVEQMKALRQFYRKYS